ncbi:chromosome segregation protein [Pseudomonas sp. 22 E 5]|uniref:AAA family ATPase n=1 Tax=Pseudomonas sp. 58 R 3 TaxID=1844108 RepID=UPI000812685C|nr:AAA family ATPase [Pseudomonas sp. 58 R 3]CRM64225.1 chromosome segregation protein [Pseudomonas sp. 58 R 3]CRM89809.1 chromosome segregation protein [Pseudomonas sp. 22 E 5]
MRLDQLHIQNFRCYEDATFEFQPGFNLVVGVNGSGKTSLLQAVAASFIDVGNATGNYTSEKSDDYVRFVIDTFENRTRFERRYPMRLEAQGDVFSHTSWASQKLRVDEIVFPDSELVGAVREGIEGLNTGIETDLPVLAFYRADRRWIAPNTSATEAITDRLSRLDGYKAWSDAAADLRDLESWIIGKTLEQLQKAYRAGGPPENGFDDELRWVNSALRFAIPQSVGIYYDIELRTLLVDFGDGKILPFNNLSDGQRGMIALFSDIARRICILNPHMGSEVLKNTSGVIIIDELDIHLHPAWQRTIVPALRGAFPRVQFIAASHSPQIIGSLQTEEVILLNDGNASHPKVTYGLDSSGVLEEVMGVSKRVPEIATDLSVLFSTLEDNELEKAKVQLQALREKAPDLPEFVRAEALLRRKEIIGR